MNENNIAVMAVSPKGMNTARLLAENIKGCTVLEKHDEQTMKEVFESYRQIIFVGAMGICVRTIAPFIKDKHTDPAVVCIDSCGNYAVPVISGHIGGANALAENVARITGGIAAVTTQSDNEGVWALDILGRRYGWKNECADMNNIIFMFVNKRQGALLIETRDSGTMMMERTVPENIKVFYRYEDIDFTKFSYLIAVTPFVHDAPVPSLWYRPQTINLGIGCRRQCPVEGIAEYIKKELTAGGISPLSVKSISTIELKKDEPLIKELQHSFDEADVNIYGADELKDMDIPNPSDKVFEVTGVYGVAESSAMKAAGGARLIMEKQKGVLTTGGNFTFAAAADKDSLRHGHIEIVGAGPGDPELVSVRGKHFLQQADLILYAGSLVPIELTYYAKNGATVRSSASLDLEQQFELMKKFYDRGLLVVRLHTGDPCIYGAIQEQMAYFDKYGMSYHITPGISAFQAAAAALESQFTIPEKVQTIILTRGEGRTPMPEKEQLHKLAKSQSTMCIYLSAGIADEVQRELMTEYPPETPVAVCYKLTWKEERIYRGELKNLAKIVHDNNLTLTTLLVVGDAIDNRRGLSRLYAHEFKHLFRK